MMAMNFTGIGSWSKAGSGAAGKAGQPGGQVGNPRMGGLLAEIYRTGSLSAQSLASVTRNPQEFTQDELRRLISAVGAAGSRWAAHQSAGGQVYATGGAVVATAWR